MNHKLKVLVATLAISFIGPAIYFCVRIFSINYTLVLSEIIFPLWPGRMLGAMEASIGTNLAFLVAVFANILWYTIIGAIAISLRLFGVSTKWLLIGSTAIVFLFIYWGAGYSLEYFSYSAFVLASLAYGLYVLILTSALNPKQTSSA